MTSVPIEQIKIMNRFRTSYGDLDGLAESIREVGLLQPVVVTSEMRLVAGERRLLAVKHLGWSEVEAHVVDNLTDLGRLLQAEQDENTCRKPFTPTEAAALRAARAEWLAPLAQQAKAQAAGQKRGIKAAVSGGKLPQQTAADRKTRDIAAHGTGYSARTLDKVDELQKIAADETKPEPTRQRAAEALATIDETGTVDGEYKAVKRAEARPVTDYADADADVRAAAWNRSFAKAIANAGKIITGFPPEQVAENADDEKAADLDQLIADLSDWRERVRKLRPGLRVVSGGRQ